ncbi:hypothetical protein [Streptomyces sp. NPDC046197]|uniref:hypothetical protein n=1 Tax=Streptomyces sp. NPDC046197 TaxID=3154337 RepID=UPI003411C263
MLGAGIGAGTWFLVLRDGSTGAAAGPSIGVTVTSSSTTFPQDEAPDGRTPAAPPARSADSATSGAGAVGRDTPPAAPASSPAAGYRRAQDPVGYTVDVPEGWSRRQKQGEKAPVVYYDSPADGRQLQIFAVSEDTPAASLSLAENDPGYGFARQPGYRPLHRTRGTTWAELSYRYDDQDKGPRQVVDHRFRAADGTLYAIRAGGPEALAPDLVRAPLTAALASFCPAGATCA